MRSLAEQTQETLQKVCEEMCDNFCRFPLVYTPESFNDKDYMGKLLEERCTKCPLKRLVG